MTTRFPLSLALAGGFAAALAGPGTAVADDAAAALAAFRACAAIGNDGERLACFDRAAGSGSLEMAERALKEAEAARREAARLQADAERERQRAEAESKALAARAEQEARADAESFGADKDRSEADFLDSRVLRLATLSSGRTIFFLENGMIWEQTETKKVREGRVVGADVRIKRAALGGFMLSVADLGIGFRVKRLK